VFSRYPCHNLDGNIVFLDAYCSMTLLHMQIKTFIINFVVQYLKVFSGNFSIMGRQKSPKSIPFSLFI